MLSRNLSCYTKIAYSYTIKFHSNSSSNPMKKNTLASSKKQLVADWPALTRTFIRPENEAARSTLIKYMEQILFGLHDFLKTHVGFTESGEPEGFGRQIYEQPYQSKS